jgi:ABC-type multidrug transport system fused ATPase/permease subunit
MLKHILQWLWQYTKGIRLRLLLNCLIGITRVIAGLLFIYVSKQLIDMATNHIPFSSTPFTIFIILLIVFLLSQVVCNNVNYWLTNQTVIKMKNDVRHKLFVHLINVIWPGKNELHSGDILNRLEEDVRVVTETVCEALPNLAITLFNLIAAFLFLFHLSPTLAIGIIFIMPFFLLASKIYFRKLRQLTKNIRTTDSHVQSVLQENLQHRIVIQTMEQSENMTDKLDNLQETLYGQTMSRTRFSTFSRSMVSAGFSIGYLTVFIWSIFQLKSGDITYGIMSAFLQLVNQIQRPTVDLTRLIPKFIHATTSIDRLHELETYPSEDIKDRHWLDGKVGIRMQNITYRYDEDSRNVLRNFSHDFLPGSRTAIMGETGAGKSTTFRLILSILRPNEGSIELYNDKEQIPTNAESRCNIVYVPQGNSLLSGTIRDNLLLGNPEATDEELYQVLHTTVADFVRELPLGLDSPCKERGTGLSEGQAQRIAIARGLLRKGNVLLMDEFSSSLDKETEKTLMQRLLNDYPNKTMIFITHHEVIANYCNDIVRLERLS